MADTDAKKRLWDAAHKAMIELKVPEHRRTHHGQAGVQVLAKNVQEWFIQSTRKK